MNIISTLCSIVALVCGIFVLIKLFQKEGVLKGILGIICMLYTYIWGWMHIKDESLNIKTWMYVWTVVIILSVIVSIVSSIVMQNVNAALGG
jgi:uncharacterized membrane-anchored protein